MTKWSFSKLKDLEKNVLM